MQCLQNPLLFTHAALPQLGSQSSRCRYTARTNLSIYFIYCNNYVYIYIIIYIHSIYNQQTVQRDSLAPESEFCFECARNFTHSFKSRSRANSCRVTVELQTLQEAGVLRQTFCPAMSVFKPGTMQWTNLPWKVCGHSEL